MNATTAKIEIVEQDIRDGQYGMGCTRAIIQHPKHGRLLLVEGFGGIAIELLVSDLHGHLLVESASDVRYVREYRGHQEHRVRAMADDIAAEFAE